VVEDKEIKEKKWLKDGICLRALREKDKAARPVR
jgi:hypothetical protein